MESKLYGPVPVFEIAVFDWNHVLKVSVEKQIAENVLFPEKKISILT